LVAASGSAPLENAQPSSLFMRNEASFLAIPLMLQKISSGLTSRLAKSS
jgi:hypothetical protein